MRPEKCAYYEKSWLQFRVGFGIGFFRDQNFGIFYSRLDRKISKIPKSRNRDRDFVFSRYPDHRNYSRFSENLRDSGFFSSLGIFIPGIRDFSLFRDFYSRDLGFLPSGYPRDFLSPLYGLRRSFLRLMSYII